MDAAAAKATAGKSQEVEFILVAGSTLKGKTPRPNLPSFDVGTKPPPGHRVIKILTELSGDERFAWNPMSLTEREEARVFFVNCLQQGLVPHRVGSDGNAGGIMSEFDPDAANIIFLPVAPVAGG